MPKIGFLMVKDSFFRDMAYMIMEICHCYYLQLL